MVNNSRNKKGKKKQPLVFAKNKKQAIAAIVVAAAFIANTIYTAVKIYDDNHPPLPSASQTVPPTGTANPALQPGQTPNNLSTANSETGAVNPQDQNIQTDTNNIYSQTVNLQKGASAQTPSTAQNSSTGASAESDVDILQKKPARKNSGKLVMISVSNSGRPDPFLPSNDSIAGAYSYLMPPPETLPKNTDATKIMATTISGILYDKYSSSAIINIEGTDYLVKKGDIINNYKVLSINKGQVAVQLGRNIYKAGVGELLTQSNFNDSNIPNLNKKFGGNDVSINVKRKGY